MSGKDLTEWMAYAEIEPFGEDRDDLRMAILGSFLGNVLYQVNTGNEDMPFAPQDLMPQFGKVAEPMNKEDAIAALDAIFTALAVATKPAPIPPPLPQQKNTDGERELEEI